MALLQCPNWHTWWMIARRDTVEKLQLPQITLYIESLGYLHSVMRPHAKCTWRNLHVHQPCNQPTIDVLNFSVMIQGSQCGDHCVGTLHWRKYQDILKIYKRPVCLDNLLHITVCRWCSLKACCLFQLTSSCPDEIEISRKPLVQISRNLINSFCWK